jgi:hypothetical protein
MLKKILLFVKNYTFLLLTSWLVCFIAACTNPFNTRDIEKPEIGEDSAIYDPPVSSDIVLTNFKYAIIQKNLSNYMNCFVNPELAYNFTYKFVPDPGTETDKFINWTLYDEENYLNTVFKQSSDISLEFLDEISFTNISQSPDSVQTNSFRYELRIVFERERDLFVGNARMKLIKNVNALWEIYYWEDTKSPDTESKCWSDLKATYKN